MEDLNITMEEYIRLEEVKARKHRKVFNWETAKYGKIWYDEDIHNLRSVESEFLAIAFNDEVSSKKILSCKPTVSSLNDEIDFRISFDDSEDEDYMIIFEKISYLDDLDFFKEFEIEFPTIVYNDAQTTKSDLLTEPILSAQYIDEFDLNDETSLSEYDEEEQNVLYFNDLFPFNIIRPDDLKSENDNDDNDIDIIQSSEGDEIIQGLNVLSETSQDKINKTFRTRSFVINLKVKIMIWNYYANEMLFYLIMNLYVPFCIPFDPKRYYKDGDSAIMLRRPIYGSSTMVQVFDFGGLSDLMDEGLSARMLMEHKDAQEVSLFTSRAWRQLFDIRGLLVHELILEFFCTFRFGQAILDLDTPRALQFQLGRARRRMSWRLCHRLIAYSIAGRSQTPEKVTVTDLFYLRGVDVDSVNVPYLLARYLRLFTTRRKSGAHISGGQFVARLAEHFGLLTAKILGGLTIIALELLVIDMAELVRLQICEQFDYTWAWVAMGPERQPDTTAGAPRVAQDALVIDEGGQADPTPVQAPPPLVAARTMP
ncbi:hypothetical protein Tco_0534275 [Tanacetum coccineum]